MKNLTILCLLICSSVLVFAQKDSVSQSIQARSVAIGHGGSNEIKINLLYTVIGIPEINYERLLEDNMGVGIALAVRLTDENIFGSRFNFIITPHYRLYFGNKKANGFFIEGNAGVVSYKEADYSSLPYTSYPPDFDYSSLDKNYTKIGLGVAAGAKFLTRNGFLGEAYLGVGRVFGSTSIDVYPRMGLTIGKRF